jgi:hypothetical protein
MLLHALPRRSLQAGVLACLCLMGVANVRADAPAATLPRYLTAVSVGLAVRLSVDETFDQDRLAPVFADALAGYVFGSDTEFAHGIGLGLSLNLSEDGGFTAPVGVMQQLVVMPSYLLYWNVAPELFALGHAGIPIAVTEGVSAGAEIGAALGYRLLAGFGAYTEAAVELFGGANSTINPVLSFEVGLFLDYEVLP